MSEHARISCGRLRAAWRAFATEGADELSNADGAMPARPAVPPVFFIAVALWTTLLACAGHMPSNVPDVGMAALALMFGALAVTATLSVFRRKTAGPRAGRTIGKFLAAGLALGIALSCACELSLRSEERALCADPAGPHAFTALADASQSEFGSSCLVRMDLSTGQTARVRILLDSRERLLCGERFLASTVVHATDENIAVRYRAQGVVATLSAYTDPERLTPQDPLGTLVRARHACIALFDQFEGPGAALCQAVLFGERNGLTADAQEFYEDAKTTGLAHLVAVSGSHLVIIVGMVEMLLRTVRVPRGLRIVLAALFMGIYVVMTGIAVSAVRAAIMGIVGLLTPLARRRGGGLSGVSVCAIAMLAADPTSATSLSLQLSALSTVGIVAFMPLAASWIAHAAPIVPRCVRDVVSMTCAATFVTLPLTAPVFAQIPLVSLLANVLAAPFFTALCLLGLAASFVACALPGTAATVLTPVVLLADAFTALTTLLAGLPFAAVPFSGDALLCAGAGAIAALLAWLTWPRATPARARVALACTSLISIMMLVSPFLPLPAPLPTSASEIRALDVGQGDALLVRSERSALLVDTGMDDTALLKSLAELGVRRLDAVLVTHPDADHCGSLGALRGAVEVGRVLVAQDGLTCTCANCTDLRRIAERVSPGTLEGVAPRDAIEVGAFTARVVGPDEYQDEGGNDDSVCLVVEYTPRESKDAGTAWTALLCGDAEAEQLETYLKDGRIGNIDLLKVPHHGAKAGLTEDVVSALAPDIAVVSVGADNSYGHPAPEIVDMLEAAGASILRTDQQGAISVRFEADRLAVATDR